MILKLLLAMNQLQIEHFVQFSFWKIIHILILKKHFFFFLHFKYYHMQDSAKHFPYITIIIPLRTIYLTVLGLSKT